MRTGSASGIQIAFLIFAVALLAVPLSGYVNTLLQAQNSDANAIGRAIPFILALAIIAAFPGLRRQAVQELRRGIIPERRHEVGLVMLGKVVVLLGVFGSVALWTWMSEGPAALAQKMAYSRDEELRHAFSREGIFVQLILGGVVAPFVEELVFRGFLYRTWEKRWGWIPSALMVSTLFGIYHPVFLSAFTSSLIFIAVLRRTGSLWGPIAVHGFSNAMIWYPFAGQLAKPPASAALGDISVWGAQLACLLFALIAVPLYLLISAREDVRDRETG